jgi:hypothetical protein
LTTTALGEGKVKASHKMPSPDMPAATCVFEDGEGVKAFFVRGLQERKKFFLHHLDSLNRTADQKIFFSRVRRMLHFAFTAFTLLENAGSSSHIW